MEMKLNRFKKSLDWESQRSGIFVLMLTLMVAGTIVFGLVSNDHRMRLEQLKKHGSELTRVLSEIPFDQLVYNKDHNGLLAIAKYYLGNTEFAYSVVTDAEGRHKAKAQQAGVTVPYRAPPADPSGWSAENSVEMHGIERDVIEFQSPIFSEGQLDGFIRIGFYVPELYISLKSISFYAAIVLPIVLIAGIFVYLLRRELRPIKNIGEAFTSSLQNNSFENIQIHGSGGLSEFVEKVNIFVEATKNKITELSVTNRELETSSKLVSYQQAKIKSVLHAMPEGIIVFDESGNLSFL